MHNDLSDLGSLILILMLITPKVMTLNVQFGDIEVDNTV